MLFLRALLVCLCLLGNAAWALDINTATEADLDGLKGIGPAMSGAMLTERQKQPFKDGADLRRRVKGLGEKKAAQLSAEGLTVNGQSYGSKP
jgi:competence protein ComEA